MIKRKSRHELSLMRDAGRIVAEVLETMKTAVQPGVSTFELDEIAHKIIKGHNAIPTFLGYGGFPATICASVNSEVVHGIPRKDVILKDGDIISVDVGATYKGLVGDSAITLPVGVISDRAKLLLEVTEKSLYAAIEKMLEGNLLEDVSGAVEDVALAHEMGIVRQYGGHGVGHNMHEEPFVFNYRAGKGGIELKTGMTIAIEPMLTLGCDDVYTLDDDWTVVTADDSWAAHFEHTIAITDNGPLILTQL